MRPLCPCFSMDIDGCHYGPCMKPIKLSFQTTIPAIYPERPQGLMQRLRKEYVSRFGETKFDLPMEMTPVESDDGGPMWVDEKRRVWKPR